MQFRDFLFLEKIYAMGLCFILLMDFGDDVFGQKVGFLYFRAPSDKSVGFGDVSAK